MMHGGFAVKTVTWDNNSQILADPVKLLNIRHLNLFPRLKLCAWKLTRQSLLTRKTTKKDWY